MSWSRTQIDLRSEEILVGAYNESKHLGSCECVLDELLDPGAELGLSLAAYERWARTH